MEVVNSWGKLLDVGGYLHEERNRRREFCLLRRQGRGSPAMKYGLDNDRQNPYNCLNARNSNLRHFTPCKERSEELQQRQASSEVPSFSTLGGFLPCPIRTASLPVGIFLPKL